MKGIRLSAAAEWSWADSDSDCDLDHRGRQRLLRGRGHSAPAGVSGPCWGRHTGHWSPATFRRAGVDGECHTLAIETHQHAQSSRAGRRRSQDLVTTDRKARDHGN
jgi:hypothetical protein